MKVDQNINTLKSQLSSMNSKQTKNQAVMSGILTELARDVVRSKEEHEKTVSALASAQKYLSHKIKSSRRVEHKPVLLVVPGNY